MGNYTILQMFENPRRGRQARNFTINAPKILDLKSSSEQIFSRKLPLGAPDVKKDMRISSVSLITSLHITLLYILGNFQYTHRKKERKQKHIYVYFLISNYFLTSTYLLSIILYVKNVFYRSFQDFLNRSNYIVTTILVY